MYVKLILRNMKSDKENYILYILTCVMLLTIMCMVNIFEKYLSTLDQFSTMALPMLISMILAGFLYYINRYMMVQRSKELALYTLMGMPEKNMINLFILESLIFLIVCDFLGSVISVISYLILILFLHIKITFSMIIQGIIQSILYVCLIQVILSILLRFSFKGQKLKNLLYKKNENEHSINTKKKKYIIILFLVCFVILLYSFRNLFLELEYK